MSNVVAYQISAQSEHLKKIVFADASADASADTIFFGVSRHFRTF